MFVHDIISCKKWLPNPTLATILAIEKVILAKTQYIYICTLVRATCIVCCLLLVDFILFVYCCIVILQIIKKKF